MNDYVPGLSTDPVRVRENRGDRQIIVPVIIVMVTIAVAYFVFVTSRSNNKILNKDMQKSIPVENR